MNPEIEAQINKPDAAQQLIRIMNLDNRVELQWRVDLVSELVKARNECEQVIADAAEMKKAWRERKAALDHVLLQAVKRGGKITSPQPLSDGYKTCYVKVTDSVVVCGQCKTHDGVHLLQDECVEFVETAEHLPDAYQRIKVEPKRAEIAKVLKQADPMNPPTYARLVTNESVVVLKPKVGAGGEA